MKTARERLIVALDYDNEKDAMALVKRLGNEVVVYKVGLELFLNTNGHIIDYLHEQNKKIFLDLKFHDIPNTTKMACKYAANKNVLMFNIHLGGGSKMIKECVQEIQKTNREALLIGVTVLTSLSDEDVQQTYGSKFNAKELALNLAQLGKQSGINGVVCSAQEAKQIKELCGKEFITVCPGIRPLWSASQDQQRIVTPKIAMENGCDYIVVGRPITQHNNPLEAVSLIVNEMEEGLK